MVGAMTTPGDASPTSEAPPETPTSDVPDEPRDLRRWFTAAIVGAVTLFVVWNLRPWAWFLDTTPTGGDLGAHVWSPAFLRDVLLPAGRLTGWTHDWYAGFPAFTFYMIVPSLLVVLVNVGLDISLPVVALVTAGLVGYVIARALGAPLWGRVAGAAGAWLLAVGFRAADGRTTGALPGLDEVRYAHEPFEIVLAVIVLPALVGWTVWRSLPARWWRAVVVVAVTVGVVLVVPVPYGISLKLVVVAGLVTLPVAAWAAGRLGGLPYPGPPLLAVMTLPFIFDRSYNIYGGNLMSTMAGEFAYSLSLSLAVLYLGVAARGMATGRYRASAAVLLALTGLTHLFGAFFALVATAAMLLVRPGRRSLWWVFTMGPVAGLLAAFWVVPFAWNTPYLNDMGWGKERRYLEALWSRGGNFGDQTFLDNDPLLQIFVVLAVVGAVLGAYRGLRFAMALALTTMAIAAAFLLLPESRLWNVRLLPYYYLGVYLMAGIGVAEIARLVVAAPSVRTRAIGARRGAIAAGAMVVVMLMLAVPMRALPFSTRDAAADPPEYGWTWSGGVLSTSELNLGPYWLSYNFRGYEEKSPTSDGGGTDEYVDLVVTMDEVGREYGCGRSLWEYESGRLGSYGTTMAPMLLPHWTDGCIGSMEGLYFEAAATTPYHFLLQSELSTAPSRAQRDLPYSGLDVAAGVPHLQALGVKYYLAFSEGAIIQARAHPDLTEVAWSGPWVVFLVDDADLVAGLDHLPVVMDGVDAGGEEWLVPSAAQFVAGEASPLIAADGPADWPRVDDLDTFVEADEADGREVPEDDRADEIRYASQRLPDWLGAEPAPVAAVSDVEVDDFSISFTVDQVGTPVLVRTSYFPNWRVSGADGPFRVSPNLMVVVPTDTEVELTYGRSPIEMVSLGASVLGLVALVALARRPAVAAGRDWWDLGAEHLQAPPRDELVRSIRDGSVGAVELAELEGQVAAVRRTALVQIGLALVLIGASLVASAVVDERADRPIAALVVWGPAGLAVVLLLFRALPGLVRSATLRWTLRPLTDMVSVVAPPPDDGPPDPPAP